MLNPTFSVVIPTCDRPEYLHEAVSSVLMQRHPAHEIIVIDNGHIPVAPTLLPESDKLRLIRALPRFGVSQARNLGVVLSSGDYIAFLDDDDSWDKGYLQAILLAAKNSNPDIILTPLRELTTGVPIKGKQASFSDEGDLMKKLLRRNPGAGGSNTIVRRTCFITSAGYDPLLTTNEDKALILDLLLKGARAVRAPEAWVQCRNDGEGPRLTELQKRIEGRRQFFRKYSYRMTVADRLFNIAQLVRLRFQHWFGRG